MDNLWERSIPFYDTGIEEIKDIFGQYDKNSEILDFAPISVGCRNTNYKIYTDKGDFLLRICPANDTSFKKEKIINELFHGNINIPELLFISEKNLTERVCLIYEFIDGVSMQEIAAKRGRFEDDIIVKAAESAAYIHSCDAGDYDEFNNDYPPFLTWYDLFLDNDIVAERIGKDISKRVKKLIENKYKDLKIIDKYISFIHSDFRPANMIIDRDNKVWIVDWEFSGFGHSLADIGQFFRYSECFEQSQINKFETVYNSLSKRTLPFDWYELSRLRDLVNPLQMLGAEENLPQKYEDLKELILNTLNFFGY